MKPLLLASLLLPLSAACLTDDTRTMRLGDAPGTIDAARDELAWSYSGGTASVVAPGTLSYPQRVTLKVDLLRDVDGHEVDEAIAMGTIEVVSGSACRLTHAVSCDGHACLAELEVTQPGVCLVRARAAAHDGEEFAQCWFRAEWEGDLADQAAVGALFEMAEHQRATCEDEL